MLRDATGDGGRILAAPSEGLVSLCYVEVADCGTWSQAASRGTVNEDTPECIDKAAGQLDSRKAKQLNNHQCPGGAQESPGAGTGHTGSQIHEASVP